MQEREALSYYFVRVRQLAVGDTPRQVPGSNLCKRPRPNSYDEFGAKLRRSRFESMVRRANGQAQAI